MAGMLYLCATPIGNLEDITLRVLRILQEADVIAAEDTRQTRKLLTHYEIRTPLTSYHEHNKMEKTPVLIKRMLEHRLFQIPVKIWPERVMRQGSRLLPCRDRRR